MCLQPRKSQIMLQTRVYIAVYVDSQLDCEQSLSSPKICRVRDGRRNGSSELHFSDLYVNFSLCAHDLRGKNTTARNLTSSSRASLNCHTYYAWSNMSIIRYQRKLPFTSLFPLELAGGEFTVTRLSIRHSRISVSCLMIFMVNLLTK